MDNRPIYPGFTQDNHGMTMLGRVVLDAWIFGLIPREEECTGWDLGRMQLLMNQVQDRWDELGGLPSRLPQDLRQKHEELYNWARQRALERGWDAELGDDD